MDKSTINVQLTKEQFDIIVTALQLYNSHMGYQTQPNIQYLSLVNLLNDIIENNE